MKKEQKRRFITVSRKYTKRALRDIALPFLPLTGRWLQEAGFSAGDIVEIDVLNGCLTIRKTANSWKIERRLECEKYMVNEAGERIQ